MFLDTRGRVLRTMRQAPPQATTRDLAVFRGILLAFWARRLGARAVIVHSDNPAVVKQITGELDVAPALIGPYLQVRALLHAYRAARVQIDRRSGARPHRVGSRGRRRARRRPG